MQFSIFNFQFENSRDSKSESADPIAGPIAARYRCRVLRVGPLKQITMLGISSSQRRTAMRPVCYLPDRRWSLL
jgi:hypothetical protein